MIERGPGFSNFSSTCCPKASRIRQTPAHRVLGPIAWARRVGPEEREARREVDIINLHLNNYNCHIAHTVCQTLCEISMVFLSSPNSLWKSMVFSHFTVEGTARKWQRQDLNQVCLHPRTGF